MRKILIADDSGTARMFIRRCLEISGFRDAEFTEAVDGKDAITKLKADQFDLVFTDLTMPVMTGTDLVKAMKVSPSLNEIPVFVITSAGNQAKEQELLSYGVKGLIKKPISPPKLIEVLKSAEIDVEL